MKSRQHSLGLILRTAGCRTLFIVLLLLISDAGYPQTAAVSSTGSPQAYLNQYCTTCHNPVAKVGQLDLKSLDPANVAPHAQTWEKVVRKVRTGMMPPANASRPSRIVIDAFAAGLEAELDRAAEASPNPGTTVLHRLNR